MKQPDGSYKHEKGFDENTPGLSHGYCPECAKKWLKQNLKK
jgi:hypothetical protein